MPFFPITLVPTCPEATGLGDLVCDCGNHATFNFAGIGAPSRRSAIRWARTFSGAPTSAYKVK